MSIFNRVVNYIKAQIKPSDYPLSYRPNPNTKDQDRILNPEQDMDNVLTDNTTPYPEQLSNNPYVTNEDLDLERGHSEGTQVANPFIGVEDLETHNPTPEPINTNPKTLKRRELMGIEDVKSINKLLAMKMEKLGILSLDKDLFMERYNQLQAKASELEVPISELIQNELL